MNTIRQLLSTELLCNDCIQNTLYCAATWQMATMTSLSRQNQHCVVYPVADLLNK